MQGLAVDLCLDRDKHRAKQAGTAGRAGGQDILGLLVIPEGHGFASAAWT